MDFMKSDSMNGTQAFLQTVLRGKQFEASKSSNLFINDFLFVHLGYGRLINDVIAAVCFIEMFHRNVTKTSDIKFYLLYYYFGR